VWLARLATQAPEIDGVCYLEDFGPAEPRPGQLRRLRVTRAHDYDLVGDLIDDPPAAPSMPVNPFHIISSPAGHRHQHQ
jgi:ribosomal protein S12 methylthiotransferase